jgi:hypothetical protein
LRFPFRRRIISAMGMPRRKPITDDQLQGFKYFKKLLPLLDRLHDYATQRDRAGNRLLHYDPYIALQLLFFFNPVVTRMRGRVQASALKKAQRQLGVCPTSLGSFSEAGGLFDAALLKPIIQELGRELAPLPHDARLDDLPGILTAVDGTQLRALAKLAGTMIQGRDLKLHMHVAGDPDCLFAAPQAERAYGPGRAGTGGVPADRHESSGG